MGALSVRAKVQGLEKNPAARPAAGLGKLLLVEPWRGLLGAASLAAPSGVPLPQRRLHAAPVAGAGAAPRPPPAASPGGSRPSSGRPDGPVRPGRDRSRPAPPREQRGSARPA